MNRYLKLGFALLRDRSRNDLAYVGNFWAELASTLFFVITFLIFIELLYARIGTIGNFAKDDFLFMALVGQFTFYVWAQTHYASMYRLVESVRTGAFDFVLLRPISSKFYTFFSAMRPVYGLFVSVPNIILFCVVINWENIHITLGTFIAGVIVWICAMIVLATIMLLLTTPVFTQGDATDMLSGSYALLSMPEIPFNYLPKGMQFLSFTLLPTLLATGGAAYVMLGKGQTMPILVGSIISSIVAVLCFNITWKKALNSYSSASS